MSASVNSINENMPAEVRALIRNKLSRTGILVIGGCDCGDEKRVQLFANRLQRPVSAADGTWRGLRSYYTDIGMGGYATLGYVTKYPEKTK